MTNKEILQKVRAYKKLQMSIKQLEEEAEATKSVIIAEMEAQHTDTITVDIFTVKHTTYTSNRVDTTALKKELPDIAQRFTRATETKRFTIS